ncbi:MAG: molybdopterin-dependent oxidoreductase, partial [Hyphomicrobiaceae bacterium]|nr:molybdopterin-dependent oxidoreductase [Hyphomicrobiaceae bacterium]
ANKLMKGFIGTANIDTNSRLCMASSVAGHKRAFGTDTVPGTYEDIEIADLVVLVGSNLAWCHPVLFQRLAAAREAHGTRVVVIDPRRTLTAEIADLHLAIAPGSDVALFAGLLAHLADNGCIDARYVADHTSGFDAALTTARALSSGDIVAATGLDASEIAAFYAMFAATEKTTTIYSQGVNQSSCGTDKVNAIINCHLATGRIGRPGMGPFSVTGQPNAMGGREVGGLANMLAAHMELSVPAHRRVVRDFWNAPHLAETAGLKAIDLFDAVGSGRIKALWIMATNPVDSLPDADRVRAAIAACPFVVVSDVTANTDTAELAHVLLPAAAWGEKDGTVTNSERRVSRQRKFLPLPGDARPDWWQIAEVAKRLGYADAFDYQGPHEIYAEYAALTGAENAGTRDLDISGHANITAADYDTLAPYQWPLTADQQAADHTAEAPAKRASIENADTRFFANGGFYTSDRRARFVPTPYRLPSSATTEAWPLVLNTGRIRDQWHTMTRTAKTARLTNHYAEPFVEIHPRDAFRLGLHRADLATISADAGRYVARVVVTDRQRPGSIFAPMHWTGQLASAGRIGPLIRPNTDPISGQPELKYSPVRVDRFAALWYGFAVTQSRPDHRQFDYAAVATAAASGGWRLEAADARAPDDWPELATRLLLDGAGRDTELLAYHDVAKGQHRFAAFTGERCVGLLFAAATPVAVSRTWAVEQLGREVDVRQRLRLLAGRPGGNERDRGTIVCACFDVGRNDIIAAIVDNGCNSLASLGERVKAGTNCGSCRSELTRLIAEANLSETA